MTLPATVTGTVYRATRVRGFASWRPQAGAREIVAQVGEILVGYSTALTVRQLFYRLVGKYGFLKSERAYKTLCEVMNRARRSGLVALDAIRDDGAQEAVPFEFDDVAAFWAMTDRDAARFRLRAQDGQPLALEVWCEARGMIPQLVEVADPYGVAVYSCGGFDHLPTKIETGRRVACRGVPTVVLHVGDLDPSGHAIVDSLADDVGEFAAGWRRRIDGAHGQIAEVVRVAVTREQVERYALPTAPPKPTDRRGDFTGYTVQAEALDVDDLQAILRDAIEARTDLAALDEVRRREDAVRQRLLAALEDVRR